MKKSNYSVDDKLKKILFCAVKNIIQIPKKNFRE